MTTSPATPSGSRFASLGTGRADAWLVLVAVATSLVVLVVLSAMSVGLWLVPGGALALAAVRLGWPTQP